MRNSSIQKILMFKEMNISLTFFLRIKIDFVKKRNFQNFQFKLFVEIKFRGPKCENVTDVKLVFKFYFMSTSFQLPKDVLFLIQGGNCILQSSEEIRPA